MAQNPGCWHKGAVDNSTLYQILITIVFWLIGAVYRYIDIISLFRGQAGQINADLLQVQSGNLFVKYFW